MTADDAHELSRAVWPIFRRAGVQVRPLLWMADNQPPQELCATLKAFWTNCVLISALLNSTVVGAIMVSHITDRPLLCCCLTSVTAARGM